MGFEGYLGILEPTKMTVFSTMAERGVLGGFLGFAVVPMILASKWRPLSWFGVILVLSVILLAETRTGLILAVLSTMVYVMVNRGTGFWQLALGLVVVGAAAYFGMGLMPGARERIQERSVDSREHAERMDPTKEGLKFIGILSAPFLPILSARDWAPPEFPAESMSAALILSP